MSFDICQYWDAKENKCGVGFKVCWRSVENPCDGKTIEIVLDGGENEKEGKEGN